MKPYAPKPVVLEPAHVSLLRLGREMGATDVPVAELVASPLWSMEASREVDRVIEYRESDLLDLFEEGELNARATVMRCKSCGAARLSFWRMMHYPGCDLDRTLTADQRWAKRNPGVRKRILRLRLIRERWAAVNGRCPKCATGIPEADRIWCLDCRDHRTALRNRRIERAASELARAA